MSSRLICIWYGTNRRFSALNASSSGVSYRGFLHEMPCARSSFVSHFCTLRSSNRGTVLLNHFEMRKDRFVQAYGSIIFVSLHPFLKHCHRCGSSTGGHVPCKIGHGLHGGIRGTIKRPFWIEESHVCRWSTGAPTSFCYVKIRW